MNDTVWWDTPGGKVTEHRVGASASCSLVLYEGEGSVTFEWAEPGRTTVIVINTSWQFPDDWTTPIAVRVGEVWLADHSGSVAIDGVGHGSAVTFGSDQAIDKLLVKADRIFVRTIGAEMSIKVRREKIGVLLGHLRECRTATGR